LYPNNATLKSVAFLSFCDYTDFMKKLGRPFTPKEKAKSMYVRVRVSKSERAEIMRRAKASKAKTESVWIRKRLLGDD